jgi:Flp pilus assembly protein TadG
MIRLRQAFPRFALPRVVSWRGTSRLGRRAAAAVEVAVAFPIVVILFGNLVDYGLMLRRHAQLAAGVGNAAGYASEIGASVSTTTLQSITTASSWLAGATAAATAATCHCPSGSPRTLGPALVCTATCPDGAVAQRYLTVTGTYTYTPLFPQVIGVAPRTLTHSATVMVR